MTDLRTAAQQALEAMRCAVPTGKITLYEWDKAMADLDAALAQQQAKPQGCDHCNHPLYAATKCRVCGRVTEPKDEPVQQAEPVAYIHRQGNHWEVSERHLDEDEKARGWTEEPLYTAPPQRKPLTEGALMGVYIDFDRTADTAWSGVEYLLRLCRAVERAHGIVGQSEDENPSFG